MTPRHTVSSRLVDPTQPDGDVEVTGSDGSVFTLPRADYARARESAATEVACLMRRQQVQLWTNAGTMAHATWMNSYRFRACGMGIPGSVMRLARRCET